MNAQFIKVSIKYLIPDGTDCYFTDKGGIMQNPRYIRNFWDEAFTEIIDVRSQGEFAVDHIPGAVNLPVLDDLQRAEVGTIYAKVSTFEARRVGASYIAENVSAHLKGHLAAKDRAFAPLVYCWRGGMRSRSMALVLAQVGWQVAVIEGGYKTYRARVRALAENLPGGLQFIVLRGLTGSGKTMLLGMLRDGGSQVLDLEGLACHRGSIMGDLWEGKPVLQPSQKLFESRLVSLLDSFDPSRPVWVESESNRIGELHLPPALWNRMRNSPVVDVNVPVRERAGYLMREYSHFSDRPDMLKKTLSGLVSQCGKKNVERWIGSVDEGDFFSVALDLLSLHYDPAYARSMVKTFRQPSHTLHAADFSRASTDGLVKGLREIENAEMPGEHP